MVVALMVAVVTAALFARGVGGQPTITGVSSPDCSGASPALTGCRCDAAVTILGTFDATAATTITFTPAGGAAGMVTCNPPITVTATQLRCTVNAVTPLGRFDVSVVQTIMMANVPHTGTTPSVSFSRAVVSGATTPACLTPSTALTSCLPGVTTLSLVGQFFDMGCGAPTVVFSPTGPTCANVMATASSLTCDLTGGSGTHTVSVDNGLGVPPGISPVSLAFTPPVVTSLATPLCQGGTSVALAGCSSNNNGVPKGGVTAPGPSLTGSPGSRLTITGSGFNVLQPASNTVAIVGPGGTIPCTVELGSLTRTSMACSLQVPDSPGLVPGSYTVSVNNGVGASSAPLPTITWGGATIASATASSCSASGTTLDCTTAPVAGTVVTVSGTGFADGYDTCPQPRSTPPCTLPTLIFTSLSFPGDPNFPPPRCEPSSTASVSFTSLTCLLSPDPTSGLPPRGTFQYVVRQNGVDSNPGVVNFPMSPVVSAVSPCDSAASPCFTGSVVTVTGSYFGGQPNLITLSGGTGPSPTCAIVMSSLTQLTCTLSVPSGSVGPWTLAVQSGSETARCDDPQQCVVHTRPDPPVITQLLSTRCTVASPGPPTRLDLCTAGPLTIIGSNFGGASSVVLTPDPSSATPGSGTAPTCAIVSATATQVVCTLTPSPTSSGTWGVQVVDSTGAASSAAHTLRVQSGNRNPTLSQPRDIYLCEDAGDFVDQSWIRTVDDGNGGTQTLTCTVTPVGLGTGLGSTSPTGPITDLSAFFTSLPACQLSGGGAQLVFSTRPDVYGSFFFEVHLEDDGTQGGCSPAPCTPCNPAQCHRSAPHSFAIHILPVNDPPVFSCPADLTVAEDAGPQSFQALFRGASPGGWRETHQQLRWDLVTDPSSLFTSPPRARACPTCTNASLEFESAPNACGRASVTATLSDDNNNNNAWFSGDLSLVPFLHMRGTTLVRNGVALVGSCANQFTSNPCQFTITVSCVDDPPVFTPGPLRVTVKEDSGYYSYRCWATKDTSGTQSVRYNVELVDPFHAALFSVQPHITPGGDLEFKPAPDAHSLNLRVLAAVQAVSDAGVVSCDLQATCPGTRCCPRIEIEITPVNDPPSFIRGGDIVLSEDEGCTGPPPSAGCPHVVTDWTTRVRVGPENEGTSSKVFEQQTPEFTLEPSDPSLFTTPPTITTTCAAVMTSGTVCEGTLSFAVAPHANGFVKVKVTLRDTGPDLALDGTTARPGTVGSNEALPQWFTINITPVNDPPILPTLPTPVVVLEDSGPFRASSWLSGVLPGPANEQGQFLTFSTTVQHPSLFKSPPTIKMSGATVASLEFEPAPDATGTSRVDVLLLDSGGTAKGGVNRATGWFDVVIEPVNDPPTFTASNREVVVVEDSGPHTLIGWAQDISPGEGEPSQRVEFHVSASDSGALFSRRPEISPTGTLSFSLVPDAFGSSFVRAVLVDEGGLSASRNFTITVLPVNDPPAFTPGPDITVQECDREEPCLITWANWASGMTAQEVGQWVEFVVTVPDTVRGLFAQTPRIHNTTGTLEFALLPRANTGSIVPITVELRDSGGTANGGADLTTHTLLLLVQPVDSAPFFIPSTMITTTEDAPPALYLAWARNISAGGPDEHGQPLSFHTKATPSTAFSVAPSISPLTGDLTFTLAKDFNGLIDVEITLTDGTRDFKTASVWYVAPVNDPPRFDPGPVVVTIWEGAGAQRLQWASNGSPGPPDEANQTWWYTVMPENPRLFATQPVMSQNGTLTFELLSHVNGDVVLWVSAVDSGMANNATAPVRLTVRVTPVNSPPSWSKGADVTVWEDFGDLLLLGWAKRITPGDHEAGQGLNFSLSVLDPSLFAAGPAIDPISGDLSLTTAKDRFGTTEVVAVLVDNGSAVPPSSNRAEPVTFTITVEPVNDPPVFTRGPDLKLVEDDLTTVFPAWATDVAPGPDNERHQRVNFSVTTTRPSLFAAGPWIDPGTGSLHFKLAPDQNGIAVATACLEDTGGVAVPGRDSNRTCQTFRFDVAAVNDPPRIERGRDIEVLEDAGAVVYRGWAHSILPGPVDEVLEPQQVVSLETRLLTGAELFAVHPQIDRRTGDLTFTTAPHASGVASLEAVLHDFGGTAGAGVSATEPFTITILPVNDPPTFTPITDRVEVLEDSPRYRAVWAAAPRPGPDDEAGQSVWFVVEELSPNTTSELFSELPAVSPQGVLTFRPAPDQYGVAQYRVTLRDSGGTSRGGVATTAPVFLTIAVLKVNDPPTFRATDLTLTIPEDAPRQVVPSWAAGVAPGPANEQGQTVDFQLDRFELWEDGTLIEGKKIFEEPPWIDASSGDLTFKVAPDIWGEIRLRVQLSDNGGTPGVDRAEPRILTIVVTPSNDPPVFECSPKVVVTEDAGPVVVAGWAKAISPGPNEERVQTTSFAVEVANASRGLFAEPPVVDQTGSLSFRPAPNVYGEAVVTVSLRDSEGLASSQAVALTILPVNDPPCFEFLPKVTVDEDSRDVTISNFVSSLCAGPPNEAHQSLTVDVMQNATLLDVFAQPPTVSPLPHLTFSLRPDRFGDYIFWIQVRDDGGVEHGGSDRTPLRPFVVSVSPVNDPPSFRPAAEVISVGLGEDYTSQWAAHISPGPFEEHQTVDFMVEVDLPGLFAVLPAVTPSGVLNFRAGGREGNSSVLVTPRDSEGLAGPPQRLLVAVRGGGSSSATYVALVDPSRFNSDQFRAALSQEVGVSAVVTESSPEGRVVFHLTDGPVAEYKLESWLRTRGPPTHLGVQHVSLPQQRGSLLPTTPPPPPGSSPSDSTSTLVAVVVSVALALLILAAVAFFCYKRRQRRLQPSNGLYKEPPSHFLGTAKPDPSNPILTAFPTSHTAISLRPSDEVVVISSPSSIPPCHSHPNPVDDVC